MEREEFVVTTAGRSHRWPSLHFDLVLNFGKPLCLPASVQICVLEKHFQGMA